MTRTAPRVRNAAIPLLALAAALSPGGGDALAEPADRSIGARLARHLAASPQLLDDPGGARTRLERLGIVPQLFAQHFVSWKAPGGGADPGGEFGHSGSYDLFVLVDAEELAGLPGLDLLAHAKGIYGRSVNDAVGAISDPIDDADADVPIYVEQLWLEQALLRDRLHLRAGMLSQQTVFDRNAYANSEDRQFLATFLDNDGVVPLPRGLGADLIASPTDWLELAVGAVDGDNSSRNAGFDTAFDGLESLTGHLELRLRTRLRSRAGELPGALRVGAFLDGRKRTVFDGAPAADAPPKTRRGSPGAWLSFDQLAYREGPQSPQGLGLFARFGWADEETNRVAWFWSIGASYLGLLPTRDADELGLGVYQAIASRRYRDAVDRNFRSETGIELYHRIAVLPWLAVTPDLQVIVDPGGWRSTDAAIVATLRVRVSF